MRRTVGMSERDLQECVRRLCNLLRLPHYHTHDSRRSAAGFPDSIIICGDLLLCWELKSETGKATTEQMAWLAALGGVRTVHAKIVRPDDWTSGRIEAALRTGVII